MSEFAGAAQSLYGAILVNPWDISSISCAMEEALFMKPEEKKTNMAKLFKYVSKFTSSYWGKSFIDKLVKAYFNIEHNQEG